VLPVEVLHESVRAGLSVPLEEEEALPCELLGVLQLVVDLGGLVLGRPGGPAMLLLVEWRGEEYECILENDVWTEIYGFCVCDDRERHGWSESVSVALSTTGAVENLISSAGIR
jgi:hypothetical protein